MTSNDGIDESDEEDLGALIYREVQLRKAEAAAAEAAAAAESEMTSTASTHHQSGSKMEISGNGEIMHDHGDVYEGEYQYRVPHGVGKMTYSDGRVSEGIWNEGEIEYEGELNCKGEPHGRGKWFYSNGNVYKGDWKDGKYDGKGKYKWNDGYSYEGGWKNDKWHGKGVLKRPDGSLWYDGEWKDDIWQGKRN